MPVGGKLTVRAPGVHDFGTSVALAGDGRTAVVGATNYGDNGAAWFFARSGSTWKQEGPEIAGSTDDSLGSSVALSADGRTALIAESIGVGHVWVYTRTGSSWTRQAKLVGRGAQADSEFGTGLALSSDGSTAIIGDPQDHDGEGAVWFFARSGSTWTQGPEFKGRGQQDGAFGQSVALSADGSTALVGWSGAHDFTGAAQLYTRSGASWKPGPTLTARGEGPLAAFGETVALSADGATALVAGRDLGAPTKVWVFTRSGGKWVQTVLGSGGVTFGSALALSGDGRTALIGEDGAAHLTGAVHVYTRSASGWSVHSTTLVGAGESGKGRFAVSVGLSTNGGAALVGGDEDDKKAGAVWTFAAR